LLRLGGYIFPGKFLIIRPLGQPALMTEVTGSTPANRTKQIAFEKRLAKQLCNSWTTKLTRIRECLHRQQKTYDSRRFLERLGFGRAAKSLNVSPRFSAWRELSAFPARLFLAAVQAYHKSLKIVGLQPPGFDVSSPNDIFCRPHKTVRPSVRQKSYPQPEVTKVK
jgi:hypothetical protein